VIKELDLRRLEDQISAGYPHSQQGKWEAYSARAVSNKKKD